MTCGIRGRSGQASRSCLPQVGTGRYETTLMTWGGPSRSTLFHPVVVPRLFRFYLVCMDRECRERGRSDVRRLIIEVTMNLRPSRAVRGSAGVSALAGLDGAVVPGSPAGLGGGEHAGGCAGVRVGPMLAVSAAAVLAALITETVLAPFPTCVGYEA
jgi:hypothetical protein